MTTPLSADLSGRTCLVTGATSGIGKEVARTLARLGATVVIGSRDRGRGEAAVAELVASTGNKNISSMEIDLAEQASIRAFAEAFGARYPKLDVLVNNAGQWSTEKQSSREGIELTWATNVLGPYLLTRLLEPQLAAAGAARIVNVVSTMAGDLDVSDVELKTRGYSGFTAYKQSKQALRMLSWHQAEALKNKKITSNAVAPGFVRTQLNRQASGFTATMMNLSAKLFAQTAEKGADTPCWVAASDENATTTNKFFDTGRKEATCKFRDAGEIRKLVDLCEKMAPSAS